MRAPDPDPTTRPAPAWRDISIVVAITLLCAWLAASFELNEALFAGTRRWEHFQLDELPVALFVLAAGLAWFAYRRYRETRVELQARRVAERQLADALAENRALAQQHIRIQESERKHLARELHDELGQYLNAIKLDAVSIREDCGDAQLVGKTVSDIVQTVDRVHAVVNGMIRRLRPVGLEELGLVAALENCVDHWRQRLPGTQFSLSASGSFDHLGESLQLTLFRLAQEGLTNAYKHAGAKHIEMSLERRSGGDRASDEVVLTVTDDGRGMEPGTKRAGFGLNGMRERVEMLGGDLSVDSAPGRGLTLRARLPSAGYE